jgi:LmbE family N-acetylglucosaminyl deacetylase
MKNILAIGAHPDDIEISCLGYLLKQNKENKSKVFVFILSSGSSYDYTSGLKRIKESREALACIKNLNFNYIRNRGIKISDYEKISNKIRKLILRTNINEILVHDPNDTNQEHRLVYDIVKTASRRLSINLIRYRSISSTNDFKANLYVDVKKYISIKKKSLQFHKTQKFHDYFSDTFLNSFHNNFFVYSRGVKVSEVFFQEFKFL